MKLLKTILAMICLLSAITTQAQTYWTPQTLPMVYLQDHTKYTINPDGILSQQAVEQLDSTLYRLEQEMGVQTVLAVVGHIEGDDPYQFGQDIADTYGIGHKGKDDGLFVMLCTEDRSYTILTGNGLEGTLPDAICRRIQNRIMVPLLKEGKWDEAIIGTINAIDLYIRGDEDFKAALEDDDVSDQDLINGVLIMGGLGAGLIGLGLYFSRRVCSKCKKRKMKAVKTELVSDEDGKEKYKITYRCTNCGNEEIVYRNINRNGGTNIGGGFGGGVIRGGFGGRGGGPIGGHFGGGHFGGGGSTGRF